jgi:hypothetical protein
MARQPPVGQGLLIIEASRSQSDTPHSIGLLWTSDQPDAETSTWQYNTHKRQILTPPRSDSKPQSQQAAVSRLRPQPLGSADDDNDDDDDDDDDKNILHYLFVLRNPHRLTQGGHGNRIRDY